MNICGTFTITRRTAKAGYNPCTTTIAKYHDDRSIVPLHLPCTSTVTEDPCSTNAKLPYRPLGNIECVKSFSETCTTTSSTVARTPTSATNLNCPACTLRRYNLETMSVNGCLRCLRCSCLHHVLCHSFPCRQLVGHPESGSAPPSFACIRTLLLCIGISIKLPEPECCRGTISLSSPWHPFLFRHDEKCFIMLLSTFN